MRMKKGMNLTR